MAITFGVDTLPNVYVLLVIFTKDAFVAEMLIVLTELAEIFVSNTTVAYRFDAPVSGRLNDIYNNVRKTYDDISLFKVSANFCSICLIICKL